MAESDDEDMRRAIALSLGQPDPGKGTQSKAIDIDSGNEKDERANGNEPAPVAQKHSKSPPTDLGGSDAQPSSLGILGLDRKRMEEERLARKRKAASPSPPPSSRQKTARTFSTASIKPTLQYPHGAVRKTWAFRHPREGNDIKLEEVLQKDSLQLAVLSSFQWDTDWLFRKLDMTKTKVTLVMQAKEESTQEEYRSQTAEIKNLRLCFPSMAGFVNCMHSKLMLLSHPTYLRVVVPTANLVPYDWGEDGTMENTVFLIDLPRLEGGKRVDEKVCPPSLRNLSILIYTPQDLPPFAQELTHFLTAQSLDPHIVASLRAFDFTAIRPFAFVHTIGGTHTTPTTLHRTGWPGLARSVNALGLATASRLQIDFLTSSLGSLDSTFLSRLYRACQGETSGAEVSELEHRFRIYFPTHETVVASRAGGAGTICVQRSYYEKEKFPRGSMRDCVSRRTGMLMHSKIVYVRPERGKAWAYVGSANCSESAWGNKIVRERGKKRGEKLSCRNWECGVVVPVEGGEGEGEGLEGVFTGTVPVPMEWPGREYSGKQPWYFMEERG